MSGMNAALDLRVHLSYSVESILAFGCQVSKVFPCSFPSVGPGADPVVKAVSPKVTLSHPPGSRLSLLSAGLPSRIASLPFGRYQIILLGVRGTCV